MDIFYFIGRTDPEAETPILWPPHAKSWLIGKDPDAGRDWGQEEKGMTEDEMAGWHHWLDGRESEWTPGVGDGQGGLAGCDSWGRKEPDTTELNWTEQGSTALIYWMCAKSLQSCGTLCDPRDCGLPGSSVHGIFQARILEWVAICFSREFTECWQSTHGIPAFLISILQTIKTMAQGGWVTCLRSHS